MSNKSKMTNKEKYKNSMNKIKPSNDLVNDTIKLVKEKTEKKETTSFIGNKKLVTLAGVLAVFILSTGTFLTFGNKTNKNISNQSEKLSGTILTEKESEKQYNKFLKDSKLNSLKEDKNKTIEISLYGKTVETKDFYTIERTMLYMNILNKLKPISKFKETKEYTEKAGYKYLNINKDESIILRVYDKYKIYIPDNLNSHFVIIDLSERFFTFYKVYVNDTKENEQFLSQLRGFITSKFEEASKVENNNNTNQEEQPENNKDDITNNKDNTTSNNDNTTNNNTNNNNDADNNNNTKPVIKKLYGDVNRDGEINSRDVAKLRNYVLAAPGSGLTGEEYSLADVNGDGEVTKLDVVLLNYSVIKLIAFDGTSYIKTPTMFGDLSNSGELEQYDYELLREVIAGTRKIEGRIRQNADINEDGKIDNTDLLILEARLKGLIAKENLLTPVLEYTIYGDVSQDGIVNTNDATQIRQYLKGTRVLDPQSIKNADVNVDGKIDEKDARLIQEFVVQMHEGTLPFKPIK